MAASRTDILPPTPTTSTATHSSSSSSSVCNARYPSVLFPALAPEEQFRYFDSEEKTWREAKEDPFKATVESLSTVYNAFRNCEIGSWSRWIHRSPYGDDIFETAAGIFRANQNPAHPIKPRFPDTIQNALDAFYPLYNRLHKVSSSFPALSAGSASFLGKRKKQEDNHCIRKIEGLNFFPQDMSGWQTWFTSLFSGIATQCDDKGISGGTTAIVGVFTPDEVCTVGFAGDSSVLEVVDNGTNVICKKLLEGKLHNAANPAEVKRLTDLGRTINAGRLVCRHGSLEVFRGFGDNNETSHQPDTIQIPPPQANTDSYLVFYSDGMEALSKEAIEGVFERLRGASEEEIATALAELADTLPDNGDNKKVIVVRRSSRTTPGFHLTGYVGVFDGHGSEGYTNSLAHQEALIAYMQKGGPVNGNVPKPKACLVM